MKVLDLNPLMYAVNRDSVHHRVASPWLDDVLSGDETIALPWVVLLGFLRISTHARILPRPLSVTQAVAVIDSWLARPHVIALDPTDQHCTTMRSMLLDAGTAGNLTLMCIWRRWASTATQSCVQPMRISVDSANFGGPIRCPQVVSRRVHRVHRQFA